MSENLWALREQKRLSVATLASRAGLPIGVIIEYESGTRSIDPRHLSRLARALYVEEAEICLRSDPRPGSGQLANQAPRPEFEPPPTTTASPPASGSQTPEQAPGRQRIARSPRVASEPRPPAPARPSQIAYLDDLIQRLGKDRAAIEAALGKPLEQLDRLEASTLSVELQAELRSAPSAERRRAYLPEAVDQYELRYLTAAQDEGADLALALFDGSHVDGQVIGFSPYSITVRQADGSELTLNKLAIVSYRKRPAAQPTDVKEQIR